MSIKGKLTQLPNRDSRRSSRRVVNVAAMLRERGAKSTEVEVIDLSTRGFKVQSNLALELYSSVWLKLVGTEALMTRVVWIEGDLAGCEFVTPLHSSVLETVIAQSRFKPAPRWRSFNGQRIFGSGG